LIPYFVVEPLRVGPLAIQPFGILAACGVWLASWLLVRTAGRSGLDVEPLEKLTGWALAGGILGAHLLHLGLYHPEELRAGGPLQLMRVWDGLSSTGGVLGGLLACVIFLRMRGLSFAPYADAFALALPAGWSVARLGCFSVHDHPGSLTSFFLAVDFPGGARHDLGLYDALVLGSIAVIVHLLRSRQRLTGKLLPLVALLYGASRFALDFLRARDLAYVDARYLGLTPAQYGCLALIGYGAWKLASPVRSRYRPPGDDEVDRVHAAVPSEART
jgi:phosphatidylglycerol:prolipoprotein diacylglycerol transferase